MKNITIRTLIRVGIMSVCMLCVRLFILDHIGIDFQTLSYTAMTAIVSFGAAMGLTE
jgi:hypothetical protein